MAKFLFDPGHGGKDSGATYGTRYEKNDVLKLATTVGNKVISAGHSVCYTRTTDKFLELSERSSMDKAGNYDYFISFHRDSFSSASASGVSTYVYYQASNKAISLANEVQSRLVPASTFLNRGVKTAGFHVLKYTKSPAILIECGFISNPNDNALFDKNFNLIVNAITDGILSIVGGSANNVSTPSSNTDKTKQEELNYSMYIFSANWYLAKNKDVASNATYKDNPYKHYIDFGKNEGRSPLPPIPLEFSEGSYLELNPDVAAAVKKGSFTSGLHHYLMYGFNEDRKICKTDTDETIQKRVADLELKLEKIKEIVN